MKTYDLAIQTKGSLELSLVSFDSEDEDGNKNRITGKIVEILSVYTNKE